MCVGEIERGERVGGLCVYFLPRVPKEREREKVCVRVCVWVVGQSHDVVVHMPSFISGPEASV